MSDHDHAVSLLKMANGDLNALRGMQSLEPAASSELFSDEIFGFHAQQAAEKCLKSWIANLGRRYPRSHDLMALLDTLDALGEGTMTFRGLVDLNSFAVQHRYELLDDNDDPLDRVVPLKEIEFLFTQVARKVSPLPQPDQRRSGGSHVSE